MFMERTSSKAKSFKRQAITVFILLLLFGAYFSVIVPRQKQFFTTRNFRLLADMSAHIAETFDTLGTAMTNAASPPRSSRAKGRPDDGPFQKAIQATSTNIGLAPLTSDAIVAAFALVPNLVLNEVRLPNDTASLSGLHFKVITVGWRSWLELDYTGGANGEVRIRARSDIQQVLKPIVQRRDFDDVLVLDAEGRVIFQLAASELKVTKLGLPADQSFQTNLVSATGADYLLFAQPLPVALTASGSDPEKSLMKWTLCGLVRADRFREQAWAVDYTILVMFIFLALLLILSWPFLNLWAMGLKGGLRVAEVFLLAFSTLFVSALLTLLALNLYAYDGMEDTLDEQLEVFAGDILSHFDQELAAVARQLDRLNERFLQPGHAANQTNVLASTNLVHLPGSPDPDPYPHFRMAVWTDLKGQQLAKWTVKERNTRMINVGHRDYFRNIAEGRPWIRSLGSEEFRFSLESLYSVNTGENLAIFTKAPTNDPEIVSGIDLRLLSLVNPVLPAGYGYCVITEDGQVLFHSDEQRNLRENFFEECDQNARLQAAVYGRMTDRFDANYSRRAHSLFVRPIPDLPWTLVVFREERMLATAQVEMVSVAGLLFLFYAGALLLVTGSFYLLGKRRHVEWVWPYQKRLGSYRLLTLANLALALLLGGVAFLFPHSWVAVLLAAVLPMFGLGLAYWLLKADRSGPAWLKLPALFKWGHISYRHGYVAAMGTLLVLLAVAPTMVFYKVAFAKEMELLAKHVQLRLVQDLGARAERLQLEIYGAKGPESVKFPPLAVPAPATFLEQRLASHLDVYTNFFFGLSFAEGPQVMCPQTTNHLPDRFTRFLAALRPHYNELDVPTRGLLPDAPADDAWQWHRQAGVLVLNKASFREDSAGDLLQLCIQSALPAWPVPEAPWGWLLWGLLLLALLVVPFFIIHTVADKVLLLYLDTPPTVSADAVWPAGKYLLLGPPHAGKSKQLTGGHFTGLKEHTAQTCNLRVVEGRRWLDPDGAEDLFKDPRRPIVLDHFEHGQHDADLTRRKLRLLQLITPDEQRTIILVANLHPLHFARTGKTADKPEKEKTSAPESSPAEAKAHWLEALAPFKRIYLEDKSWDWQKDIRPGSTLHQAHGHYRSLWATFSPGEQETLFHLAQGRIISSYQPELRTLLARHIVLRDPKLRLRDEPHENFRYFILSAYRPEPADEAQGEEAAGFWSAMKGPATTVLVIVAAFIFMTQRNLWNYTIGLVPAFMAGLGALAQVLNLFQKQKLKKIQADQ